MYDPRQTVDPKAVVALGFDDEDFLHELETADGDWRDRLEAMLLTDPKTAAGSGFEGFVDGEVIIQARAGIKGREDDDLLTAAQARDTRKGMKLDHGKTNRNVWSAWVQGVTADPTVIPDLPEEVQARLSSRNEKHRQDAFGDLPYALCDYLMVRLLVHIRHSKRGPMRDPGQVTPRPGKARPSPSSSSADTPSAIAQRESD